jgi:hypothetical protein
LTGLRCIGNFRKFDVTTWIDVDELPSVKRVFGSVVVVAFQIAFRAEIHANDVFLFFKNHF